MTVAVEEKKAFHTADMNDQAVIQPVFWNCDCTTINARWVFGWQSRGLVSKWHNDVGINGIIFVESRIHGPEMGQLDVQPGLCIQRVPVCRHLSRMHAELEFPGGVQLYQVAI